jgi:O-antigen/teichoic acid export membrane protein
MPLPAALKKLRAKLVHEVRSQRHLLTNAGSMFGTTIVTSLLGVAFWWLAAHEFSKHAVGVAAAAVGAMTLLGFMSTLGLGTLLMGELPQLDSGHRSLINAALAITGPAGAIVGVLFALVAPEISSNFEPLSESWITVVAFATGVGLTALALVLDQALIGLLRGSLQLQRNAVFAGVKLAALVPIAALIADAGSAWIYSAWTVGIAASLFVMTRFYRHRGGDPLRPDFGPLREMRVSAASHHAFNVALQIPAMAMPVLVVGLVSAEANASFYIAWMIAGLLAMVPISLATVLYPIGSQDSSRMTQGLKLTLTIAFSLGLLANLILVPGAVPILEVFGSSYAEQGAATLHILVLGVFPLTFKTLYVSVHRVQRKLGSALPIVWGGTILELIGAVVGSKLGDGLTGIAWGWLAAVYIEGIVMAGDVLKAVRSPASPETAHALEADQIAEAEAPGWIKT